MNIQTYNMPDGTKQTVVSISKRNLETLVNIQDSDKPQIYRNTKEGPLFLVVQADAEHYKDRPAAQEAYGLK